MSSCVLAVYAFVALCGVMRSYVISWPATMWGPAIAMVRVVHPSVRLSHDNFSETKRDRHMVTRKLEFETELPDLESAIRFAIGSTVPPFWVFPGWHCAHSDKMGRLA